MTDLTPSIITGYVALSVMGILLLTGVVVTAMGRRNHGSAATIGMMGCIALLLGVVFDLLRNLLFETLVETLGISPSLFFMIGTVITLLLDVTGTGLLIWAVVARRKPPAPAGPQGPGWQQPSDWQQPGWQGQRPGPQPGPHPGPQPGRQPGWPPPQQQPGWQTPPQPPSGEGPR
ncbi:hypothetical protein ABZ897_47910 [Nonomuraea sp. NPDC046802]|uniref:hypothetical protein n=1 Tax=Nonomuraea sp. NPDC046802 TaxID=3154919 RepID=UPI00340CE662